MIQIPNLHWSSDSAVEAAQMASKERKDTLGMKMKAVDEEEY